MAGYDEGPGCGVQLVGPLEYFHRASGPREKRRRKETGSGTADDGNLWSGFSACAFFDSLLQCDLPPHQCLVAHR